MKKLNNYVFNEGNKDVDLKKAQIVQKKLIPPKIIFFLLPILFILMIIFKIWTGENSFYSDVIFIIFVVYMFAGLPLMIILTLVGSICPHCHRFQRPTSSSFGMDGDKLFIFRGISPFINHCSRCRAPLSVKAVHKLYEENHRQHEL